MIIAVVELAIAASDDASGAAVPHARRAHRVLPIVAARLFRQLSLPVAKNGAIARIGKWAAGLDVCNRVERLARQRFAAHIAGKAERRAGDDGETERQRAHQAFGFSLRRMPSSRSCFSSTVLGAPTRRSCARCVFGKAITSRIDS